MTTDPHDIEQLIARVGFAFVPSVAMQTLLGSALIAGEWSAFAASWDALSTDQYMADGGRYRRRRFAAFAVSAGVIARKKHQPHYQSRDYNVLNGGIERWFEPVSDEIAGHQLTRAIVSVGQALFDGLATEGGRPLTWHVEMHQFRIETVPDQVASPTPEGLHRDGVDWVLVVLVRRENVASGITEIVGVDRSPLGSFTLTNALDTVFLNDRRVFHRVTAITPIHAGISAFRDVLVVTFRAWTDARPPE